MIKIDENKCIGCSKCVKDCFPADIEMVQGKAVAKNETCIECGHCIAICPVFAVTDDAYDMGEIIAFSEEAFEIEENKLLNFIKFRRTIRQFTDEDVSEYQLLKIIEAGRYTQTASNRQDVSYIVIKEKLMDLKKITISVLNVLGQYILDNLDEKTIPFKRYGDRWTGMYKDFVENPKDDKLFFNAPVVVVVTASSEVDAALASSNMELMADSMGLGTFFSGYFIKAAQESPEIQRMLGIEPGKKIVTCMVFGHPAVSYERTVPRKHPEISWM